MDSAEKLAQQGSYQEAILELVRQKKGGVSFVEIEHFLSPYMEVNGSQVLSLADFPNIVLWSGMSVPFCEVISTLIKRQTLRASPVESLVYAADGKVLSLPLATLATQYRSPHWLPVAFDLGNASFSERKGNGQES